MSSATVTLWEGRLDPSEALRASLDDAERERARRFRTPGDRERFIAGRGTLRFILAHHLDIPARALRFGYSAEGKPFLSDYPEVRFNLSHADEHFLVGVSREGRLGVDLERVPDEGVVSATAGRVLSPPEAALLQALEGTARAEWFARVWTRKEACVKADGRGLGQDLTALDVATAPPRVLVREDSGVWSASPNWTVRSIPVESGFAGAVAAEGDYWRVVRVSWPGPLELER